MRRLVFALLTIALLTGAYFLYVGPVGAKLAKAKYQRDHKDELALVAEAKSDIRQRLKDPYSAKWGLIIVARDTSKPTNKYSICGNVNSKNGFGAYGGMQEWVYYSDGPIYSGDFVQIMDPLQAKYCMAVLLDSLKVYSTLFIKADSV